PSWKKWFPRISVHFSPVLTPPPLDHVSVTEARTRLTDWLRDQMVRQQFETGMELGPRTVPETIVETARQRPKHVVLQDVTMRDLTCRRLIVGADLLAAQWQKRFEKAEERIGVLLPNVNAIPVVLLSLWAAGKVPAILNYSTGTAILLACIRL